MIRKKYNSLFVFDLETTGVNYKENNIIEIGIVYYTLNKERYKYELSKELDYLIKIDYKIPDEIVNLTHITDEMLNNQGILEYDMLKIVDELIKDDTLIIGYNVNFDYLFLNEAFKRHFNRELTQDALDVFAIYKDRYPYPHKLCNAIEKFNVTIPNSHRAIDDVKATFEVLKCLIRDTNDMHLYINKFGYNPKYPIKDKLKNIEYIPQRGGLLEIKKAHQ